jgi:hypothetical protein
LVLFFFCFGVWFPRFHARWFVAVMLSDLNLCNLNIRTSFDFIHVFIDCNYGDVLSQYLWRFSYIAALGFYIYFHGYPLLFVFIVSPCSLMSIVMNLPLEEYCQPGLHFGSWGLEWALCSGLSVGASYNLGFLMVGL